jgi:hypothetical protein
VVEIVTLPSDKAPKNVVEHIDMLTCFLSPVPRPSELSTAVLPYNVPLQVLTPLAVIKAALDYTSFAGNAVAVNDWLVEIQRTNTQLMRCLAQTGPGNKILNVTKAKLANINRAAAAATRLTELIKIEPSVEILAKIDLELGVVNNKVPWAARWGAPMSPGFLGLGQCFPPPPGRSEPLFLSKFAEGCFGFRLQALQALQVLQALQALQALHFRP